jgi:hypothetical protein
LLLDLEKYFIINNTFNGGIEYFWSQLIFWQRKYWQNLMD